MELGFVKHNVLHRRVSKLLNEPPATADKISQTGPTCLEKLVQLIHNIIFIIIIIIIPLFTLGSIIALILVGLSKCMKQIISIKHNTGLRIATGRRSNQLPIYKCGRGFELVTTVKKSS